MLMMGLYLIYAKEGILLNIYTIVEILNDCKKLFFFFDQVKMNAVF